MSRFDADAAALNAACLDEFGDEILYTPLVGAPFVIIGIATNKRNSLDFDPIPAQYMVRWCSLADFSNTPVKGDFFTLDGEDFTIVDLRFEDGGGGVYLVGDKQ